MYDKEYNITGVLDWTWSQACPWEQFALFPHELGRQLSATELVDKSSRALFLNVFKEEERKYNESIPLTSYMRSKAARIAELVNSYQDISEERDYIPMQQVKELIRLMYGDEEDWESVKRMAKEDLKI